MTDPIIKELEDARAELDELWSGVALRHIRITDHTPGKPPVDITDRYDDGYKRATNALFKATTVLRKRPRVASQKKARPASPPAEPIQCKG